MHRFDLWAPDAGSVEIHLDDDRVAMAPSDGPAGRRAPAGGWWSAEVEGAGPGCDYRYALDGGPPRPDPRSRWQPHGPDGPSRVLNSARFEWHDADWRGVHLAGAVLYELHVGTFSPEGTFDGAIAYLDHLVELGVDAVELLPVAEFPGRRGWGYDGVDLYAPHHAYGGPEGLVRLVDACHRRGLGVVMDVVYNHLGPSGNYLGEFGPYFTDRYRTPWGQAVNFDGEGSDEVRRFFVDNALMWLRDYHCDGLRLDAVHAIVDTSATHLLEQIATEVAELAAHVGRPLFVIAESDLNDPRVVTSRDRGGYGMDAQWSDDLHHALHVALTGETSGYYADFSSLNDLVKAIRAAFVYDGRFSAHRGRAHGRAPDRLPGWSFLAYSQNHDQVGNRAMGERTAALVGPGRLKIAAAVVLLSPFVPMLFQGEEWAASTPFQYFTDHPDPELGRAVSEGRRGEFASFGWDPSQVPDPQDPATFERSRLDWSEPGRAPHSEILDWYRQMISLRRRFADLTDGRLDRVLTEAGDGWFAVRRGAVLLAVNIGPGPVDVAGPDGGQLVAASEEAVAWDGDAGRLRLPADSVAVVVAPS